MKIQTLLLAIASTTMAVSLIGCGPPPPPEAEDLSPEEIQDLRQEQIEAQRKRNEANANK